MARGIIGKMVRGAAEAGVPMLIEQEKNNQLAKREKALMQIEQQYRTQDRAADQAFTAGQNQLDREARASEFSATQANAAAELDMQAQGLEMDRERINLTARQLEQTLQQGEFGIIEQRRLQGLYDVIVNPESSAEELSRAIQTLANLKGEKPDRYSAITLYGDENDMGVQSRQTAIMDNSTGTLMETPSVRSNTGASNSLDADVQAVMEANPGATREQAIRYLQSIGRYQP